MDTSTNGGIRHAASVDAINRFGCPNCGKAKCSQFIAPAESNPMKAFMYQCHNKNCEEVFVAFAEGVEGPNPKFTGQAGLLTVAKHPFDRSENKVRQVSDKNLLPA